MREDKKSTAFWFAILLLTILIPAYVVWRWVVGDFHPIQIPEIPIHLYKWKHTIPARQISQWFNIPFLLIFVSMIVLWFKTEHTRILRNEGRAYIIGNILWGLLPIGWYLLRRKEVSAWEAIIPGTLVLLVISLTALFISRKKVALFVPLVSGYMLGIIFLMDMWRNPLWAGLGGFPFATAVVVATGYIFSILFWVWFVVVGLIHIGKTVVLNVWDKLTSAYTHVVTPVKAYIRGWSSPSKVGPAEKEEVVAMPPPPQQSAEKKTNTPPPVAAEQPAFPAPPVENNDPPVLPHVVEEIESKT